MSFCLDRERIYIQHVRYELQKRLKRLNTATQESLLSTLVQTWEFLQTDEITPVSFCPYARVSF